MGRMGIPKGWLDCPPYSTSMIAGKFVVLKTPLSEKYNKQLAPGKHFPPQDIFNLTQKKNEKIGLWIDLTNTDRYYSKEAVKSEDCEYVKLRCQGHGECPTREATKTFISIVDDFVSRKPSEYVAVHCTHGFNRTGFLVVAFLVEKLQLNVKEALDLFTNARKPGIYRGNYILELFKRYGNISEAPAAPPLPHWSEAEKYSHRNHTRLPPSKEIPLSWRDRKDQPEVLNNQTAWRINRNTSNNYSWRVRGEPEMVHSQRSWPNRDIPSTYDKDPTQRHVRTPTPRFYRASPPRHYGPPPPLPRRNNRCLPPKQSRTLNNNIGHASRNLQKSWREEERSDHSINRNRR